MTSKPSTIGRYELLAEIGRGGMGTLYRAWDPKLDRQIAIKLLNQDNEELRERFAREARSAARLRHAHIVTVFDVGEDAGRPYIAMEYIQGQTLADLIRSRAGLSTRRKIELAEALCEGLAHAHKAGIVHRDIKPANVMVDANGQLKILDFGIARLAASESMTRAGMLIGTLSYMSPEQVSGQVADHRADIFAVGALLYEFLSYRQAFPGGLEDGLLHRLIQVDPEPLETVCHGIDPELTRIVSRCLEKKPENRYPDLAAMIEDLQRVKIRLSGSEDSTQVDVQREPRSARPKSTPTPTPDLSRKAADREELSRRRESQIHMYLDQAQKALDSGEFESGIAACEEILLRDAENTRAIELLEHAKTALDVRQAEEWLGEAERELQRGALTAALALIERAAALDPTSARAAQLRRTAEEALREREQIRHRAEAIRRVLQRAHGAFDQGRFNEAAAAADEALALAPDSLEAKTLKEQAADAIAAREREEIERRVRESVREAKRMFGAGSHDSAINLLARFEPQHPVVSQALDQLRVEAVRIAEQRRIEAERRAKQQHLSAELVLARGEIGRQEYADALLRLQALPEDDRHSPEVLSLIHEAEAGQAELERIEKIARDVAEHVARAAGLFARNDLTAAMARVDAALALDASHGAALALRRKVDDAARVIAERRKAEERLALERKAKIADGLAQAARAESHEEAIAALNEVLELDPEHAEARALLDSRRDALLREQADRRQRLEAEKARREQERQLQSVDEAEITIAPGEFGGALEAIETAQTLAPTGHTLVSEGAAGLPSSDIASAGADRFEPPANERSSQDTPAVHTAASVQIPASVAAAETAARRRGSVDLSARMSPKVATPAADGARKKIPVRVAGLVAAAMLGFIVVAYFQLRGPEPAIETTTPPSVSETASVAAPPPEPAVSAPAPPPVQAAEPAADRPSPADAAVRKEDPKAAAALNDAQAGLARARESASAVVGPAARRSGAYAAAALKEREAGQLARNGDTVGATGASREAAELYRQATAEGKKPAAGATTQPGSATSAPAARGSSSPSTAAASPSDAATQPASGPPSSTAVPPPTASTQSQPGSSPQPTNPPPASPPAAPSSSASAGNVPPPAPAPQNVPPPVAVQPPASASTGPQADEPAIRNVLAAYAAAYSELDAAAVKRVYPSIDEQGLRRLFGGLRSQRMQILGPQITISGNTATVSGTVETVFTGQVGGQQRDSRSTQFRLQKANGAWTIVERR